ncbi:hypothetical protein V1514DRAFT_320759 [Lipomyces japonicus]|uniref:uncharacterized protein n=1 Tax=Lipomyces japonicus TaxID=56871 RepID=UPI0034CE24F8
MISSAAFLKTVEAGVMMGSKSGRGGARFQCSECNASYSRISHLKRHEVKHTGEKSFPCEFCESRFYRADIARRHSKNCTARGSQQISEQHKRGKKRKSCDACARAKVACDSELPCETCAVNGHECTYFRLQEDFLKRLHGQQFCLQQQQQQQEQEEQPQQDETATSMALDQYMSDNSSEARRDCVSIPFLLNFVQSSTRTMPSIYGYANPSLRFFMPASMTGDGQFSHFTQPDSFELVNPAVSQDLWHAKSNPFVFDSILNDSNGSDDWNSYYSFDFMTAMPAIAGGGNNWVTINYAMDNSRPGLESRANDIVTCVCRSVGDAEMTATIRQLINGLFTAQNVELFVSQYFGQWHAHCAILHQPTFDLRRVPTPLLATCCMLGALFSDQQHASMATELLDVVEEYVFTTPEFLRLIGKNYDERDDCDDDMSTLQAAFLISLVQGVSGALPAQRRIRKRRYIDIVTAARALRLPKLVNKMTTTTTDDNDDDDDDEGNKKKHDFLSWPEFIKNECRVRLMCFIFIIDCELAIFHNVPPRLAVSEMVGGMPCAEDKFAAPTAAQWNALNWTKPRRPKRRRRRWQQWQSLSVASFVMRLLDDGKEEEDNEDEHDDDDEDGDGDDYDRLSTLDLFAGIHALHSVIFTARTNFLGTSMVHSLDRALNRWITIWNSHPGGDTTMSNDMDGSACRHAAEFWWLAKRMVDKELRNKCVLPKVFDVDDMSHIGRLLQDFEGLDV